MKKIILLAAVICLSSAQESCCAQNKQLDAPDYFEKAARKDFDRLMRAILSSIDVYASLASLSGAEADSKKIVESFKTVVWPLLISALDRKKMSKKEGWLELVAHLRNHDARQAERDNAWYLSKLMSLTIDLEHNADNDAFRAGLAEAYLSLTRR